MTIRTLIVVLFGISIVCSPVFAQVAGPSNPNVNSTSSSIITVTTDKISYNDGDKITISGTVRDYVSGSPMSIRVISPIGNIVIVDQVDVQTDRTFSLTLTASGVLWQQPSGTFTVAAQYGSANISAHTTFQFTGSGSSGQIGNSIQVEDTGIFVKYSITNGKVLGIKADVQSNSIILPIHTTGSGMLTVTLPRGLIDALINGQDGYFNVLNDGQSANFQEISKTTTDRTLSIPFADGTQNIQVVGTKLVSQTVPTPVPPTPAPTTTPTNSTIPPIPHWVKSLFGLYAQGQVSDSDLISALQFLIKVGVIKVS